MFLGGRRRRSLVARRRAVVVTDHVYSACDACCVVMLLCASGKILKGFLYFARKIFCRAHNEKKQKKPDDGEEGMCEYNFQRFVIVTLACAWF